MASKRLPGKVLKNLVGELVLSRVIKQIKKAKKVSKIIIATSRNKIDLKIVNFCKYKFSSIDIGPTNNFFYICYTF